MSERISPKAELIITLLKIEAALKDPKPVDLAVAQALVKHALQVCERVGNEARAPKKEKSA